MMIEQGKIIRIKGGTAYVEISKKPQCEGCKACVFNDNNKTVIPSLMEKECKTGDNVVVRLAEKQYALAPLFLFGVPLILFLIGLFVGKAIGGEVFMLIFGFLFAAGGLFIAVLADKSIRTNKTYMPVIIDKILISENSEDKK